MLVLDGVTDPRNLGACLRTANAAGVDAVILPKRNSAPLSAVALKTAQGGAEDLFIVQVTNLARCLTWLREQGVVVAGCRWRRRSGLACYGFKCAARSCYGQ